MREGGGRGGGAGRGASPIRSDPGGERRSRRSLPLLPAGAAGSGARAGGSDELGTSQRVDAVAGRWRSLPRDFPSFTLTLGSPRGC